MYPITRRNDPELSMATESYAPVRVSHIEVEGMPALLVRGYSVMALLDELDLAMADYKVLDRTRRSAHVWGSSESAARGEILDALRRASDLSGVDLVIEPEAAVATAAVASR